ncbi:KAP-like P-loop domain-containing protein [Litoreibacter ponti]|uniref:KAP-like P-loop domain-containing protein n=1 Tax=Litoreibacter ponti TaxID=1510457 RepID=A0A2T6BDA2_9RHOB|nr:P-loop NTPase fold protein [Litoreibacter ponti]PTX54026.1 KAP-like P-loop domain-containing protein [Litoreibacter ponti]
MVAAPQALPEIVSVEGAPTDDVDLIIVPGGDRPGATALREHLATLVGLAHGGQLTDGGLHWFGQPERRFLVLPPISEPEDYEETLERALLSETAPGGSIYITHGALSDFDVSLGREGLWLSEVLSRVFSEMSDDMRPAIVEVGTPPELRAMFDSDGAIQSSAPKAKVPEPDEQTAFALRLLNRVLRGSLPRSNGQTHLEFTEILAPTNEELLVLTAAYLTANPHLAQKTETANDRVVHAFYVDGIVRSMSGSGPDIRQDILDLTNFRSDETNAHLTNFETVLSGVKLEVFASFRGKDSVRIFIPISPDPQKGDFIEVDPVISAISEIGTADDWPEQVTFRFAYDTPLSDAAHTQLRHSVKRAIERHGGTYQPPDDPALDDDSPVNEMPAQFHPDYALTHPDEDDLGRAAIAETIVENVRRVWGAQRTASRPFAIHLSGRWGSGKSSILTFLKDKLVHDYTFFEPSPGTIYKQKKEGWVVIEYNAWQMQEAGPPWWSLLTTVREQGYAALKGKGHMPRLQDWLWRNTRVAWPWLGALAVIAAGLLAFTIFGDSETMGSLFDAENAWKFVAAIVTALGSLGALAKLVQGWSQSATETAEAVRDLQSDPTAVVKARFKKIITTIERPVAVFIDDLDRCEAGFVVELLQSLQTAYAQVPVLYVVASDREWIVSAYNQVYKDFKPEISKPGAPLGYLFVKKIFQLSVPVPDLAPGDRTRLTEALLKSKAKTPVLTATREARVQKIEAAAAKGDLSEVSRIQKKALSEGQNLADAVMKAVTEPKNQMKLRHQLLEYTHLFDGNPRAIKRIINALTFRQGYILSAAEDIAFNVIARWTILSLNHPYSADLLSENPARIDAVFAGPPAPGETEFPNRAAAALILDGLGKEDIEQIAAFG